MPSLPPATTTAPRPASNQAVQSRRSGAASVSASDHAVPFHSQIWLPGLIVVVPTVCEPPPSATHRPRNGSNASAVAPSGAGPLAARCVQLVPFHSHVDIGTPNAPLATSMTVTARVLSNASRGPFGAGGTVTGERWIQLVPSCSQVSS